jgi:hypothetical protein
MKKTSKKNTLRAMSQHLGIKVQFVHYFGDDVHGKLLPREKRILINARKPKIEHVYTLLHEIGHFMLHFKNLPRIHHPRIFDINWRAAWLARFNSIVRRYYRFIFNKESGKEWEADVWAMCAFVYLARHFGFRQELMSFLNRHPEKTSIFLLAAYSFVYSRIKSRMKKVARTITLPFQAILKFAGS